MASSDLVWLRVRDLKITVSFEILHTVFSPKIESKVLLRATRTISTSVTIEHLFLIALNADARASGPNISLWGPAKSKSAVE
jgi:hypothetical protein